MQLFMLRSHNFEEPRYERGVNYKGLNQAYSFFCSSCPHTGWSWGQKKTIFTLPNMYPWIAPLSYLADEMSAVFGAPISIQLG